MRHYNFLRKILTGLTIHQEYLCLGGDLPSPLSFQLQSTSSSLPADISTRHIFIGYKPLVIIIPSNRTDELYSLLQDQDRIHIMALQKECPEVTLANLELRRVDKRNYGDEVAFVYVGINGQHHFISAVYQNLARVINFLRRKRAGNVSLEGNLYDQVRIAYAIPRKIALITVSDGAMINMFPTDLHGPLGSGYYMSSLRIGGKANAQVEKYKRIVISEIDFIFYKEIYALGKNHMVDLKPENDFGIFEKRSSAFGMPLPRGVVLYRELQLHESFDIGIHRIHVYQVLNEARIATAFPLTHIHQYYGQWRIDHQLETQFLIR